jgi:hypothetical protein
MVKAGEGVVSLSFEARDARDARAQAADKGYAVLGVQGGAWSLSLPQRRHRFPLLLFTQELLALLNAGISLVEALETLAEKESRAESRSVLQGLLDLLREGKSFSASLQANPAIFPDLYVASVRASERVITWNTAFSAAHARHSRAAQCIVSPVGRLDKATSGLLFFTDDGQLLHRLTSPKYHQPKVYRATLAEDLRGNDYYWIGYRGKLSRPDEGTDLRAIYEGYVSVSPLHVDLTHEAFLRTLQTSWPD